MAEGVVCVLKKVTPSQVIEQIIIDCSINARLNLTETFNARLNLTQAMKNSVGAS